MKIKEGHLPKTCQKPVLQPPQEDEFHGNAGRTSGSSLSNVDVEKQHGEQCGEAVGPVDAHHHSHLDANLREPRVVVPGRGSTLLIVFFGFTCNKAFGATTSI